MNDNSAKNASQIRRQHNQDLIRKMRNGESLTSFDSKASWYPPRPSIEKDKREMARLYNDGAPEYLKAGSRSEQRPTEAQRPLKVIGPESR